MWTYYDYCGELYHHGVIGMRWGHRKDRYTRLTERRARLVGKQAKQQERSDFYANKLAQPNSMKRQAKVAKYKAKWEKAESKARRARARMNSGKTISNRQAGKIAKAEKYKGLMNKYMAKDSKFMAKKAKADYKIAKYQKRINRIDKRIAKSQMSQKSIDRGKRYVAV